MNRRSFLGLLAGAGAAFACGLPSIQPALIYPHNAVDLANRDTNRLIGQIGKTINSRSPWVDIPLWSGEVLHRPNAAYICRNV